MSPWSKFFASCACLASCWIATAGAAETAYEDAEIAKARRMLMERLKAAEQAGVVIQRTESQTPSNARKQSPAPSDSRVDGQPEIIQDDCLNAFQIADRRMSLGDDPLASIDLLRQLAQEAAHGAEEAFIDQLALAYLSIGFADEAMAMATRLRPANGRAAAIALVAAAAGANPPTAHASAPPALCGALGVLAKFAASSAPSRPPAISAEMMDEVATLPSPLNTAVGMRLVSRLIDLRNAEDAARILALVEGLADSADMAAIASLRDRLAALNALPGDDGADTPLPDRLEKLALLVAHPEFAKEANPEAAKRNLALLADLGAPRAMTQSTLLTLAPRHIADAFLARALMRAGQIQSAREIVDRYHGDETFSPLRADLARAAADLASSIGSSTSYVSAWRSGDWLAAERGLAENFAEAPTIGTARKLVIASALAGRKAPPQAAGELLRRSEYDRALPSWFNASPSQMTIDAARRFSAAVDDEISGIKAMVNHE